MVQYTVFSAMLRGIMKILRDLNVHKKVSLLKSIFHVKLKNNDENLMLNERTFLMQLQLHIVLAPGFKIT